MDLNLPIKQIAVIKDGTVIDLVVAEVLPGGKILLEREISPDEKFAEYSFEKPAALGWKWDGEFFTPPKPHPSWVLNEADHLYEPPIPYPTDGLTYLWDEESISWKLLDLS